MKNKDTHLFLGRNGVLVINKGVLFLIPIPIAEDTQGADLSPRIREVVTQTQHYLAENLRTARRFLSTFKVHHIESLSIQVLDKDTSRTALPELMAPLWQGFNMGVMSESGCPGIADPGALAVGFAHEHGIQVVPLVGPSSVLLALMASGFNGQRFTFHGYLPVDRQDLTRRIQDLERESRKEQTTQIFIETPYRNNSLLQILLQVLSPGVKLTVAVDLTGKSENVSTKTIAQWRATTPELPKLPAIFLILAA